MSLYPTHNFKIYILINNFKTQDTELNFGDFRIISVKPGSNAVEWRKKLGSRQLPEHILIKEINWKADEDDMDVYQGIINPIYTDLQLAFRLFKVGDIKFGDFLIEERGETSSNVYSLEGFPGSQYEFGQDQIEEFKKFRKDITEKTGYRNKFYKFALDYFMSGVDKGSSYKMNPQKIVDYIIALESLFLIDNEGYFLRSTLAKRISEFLKDDVKEKDWDIEKIVKYMYDERSNIVHGNNINLSEDEQWNRYQEIEVDYMPKFEDLMRKVFRKLFDSNFSKKEDMVKFMKGLYDVPTESLEIMRSAQNKAKK